MPYVPAKCDDFFDDTIRQNVIHHQVGIGEVELDRHDVEAVAGGHAVFQANLELVLSYSAARDLLHFAVHKSRLQLV